MQSTYIPPPIPTSGEILTAFQELNLHPGSYEDRQELTKLLTQYLNYPSDHLANIHYEAQRLGQFDEIGHRLALKSEFLVTGLAKETCPCCCCLVQVPVDYGVPIPQMVTVGPSIRNFFEDIIMCMLLMLISVVIFAIYAFVSNIVASSIYQNPADCSARNMCGLSLIAVGTKVFNNRVPNAEHLFVVQAYLGMAMCFVWIVVFVLKVYRERYVQLEQERMSPTAANFTVMFENLPKEYTGQMLQAKLNDYAARVRPRMIHPQSSMFPNNTYDVGFTMTSFNSPKAYYESLQAENIREQSLTEYDLEMRYEVLRNMIINRGLYGSFLESPEIRRQLCLSIDRLRSEVVVERVNNLKIIEANYLQANALSSTKIVFVTFNHTFAKVNLLRLNRGIFGGRACGGCSSNQTQDLDIPNIVISPAPEPENIIWQNVGAPWRQVLFRKFITYLASAVLLAISFGAAIGLSFAQKNGNNVALSLLLSFIINVINILLSVLIQYLTIFELDYTITGYQTSVVLKIVVTQLINSVVFQIIVTRFIKKNIYEQGGLTDDVFYFALINSLLPPLVRLINPYYIFKRWQLWRARTPRNKLQIESQIQYNRLWQNPEFEIGLEYAYPVRTVIWTAFFMSLQPIIVLFAILGFILMYYAEKFALYYRSMRPRSESVFLSRFVKYLLYFSIIAYGFGSLTWSNFLPNSYPHRAFIPSVIAIVSGVLLYIAIFFDAPMWCYPNYYVPKDYDEERVFFPSEYDRLNPATRARGVRRFLKYMERKRFQMAQKLIRNQNAHDVDALLAISRYNPINQAAGIQEARQVQNTMLLSGYTPPAVPIISPGTFDATSSTMLFTTNPMLFSSSPVLPVIPPSATIDTNALGDVIVTNELPGQQRPNLYSTRYNPLDFIEAAESTIFRSDGE